MSAHMKTVRDRSHALALLAEGKTKLGHNTYLVDTPDGPAVRYHSTNIVTYLADGNYRVDFGGWYTSTTRDRVNEFTPANISGRNDNLYLYPEGCKNGRVRIDGPFTVRANGFPVDIGVRWQILALDVWGNKKDGWEINDQIATSDYFWTDTDCTSEEALIALRRALGHKADARGYHDPYRDDEALCFHTNRDGKPAYYARKA
jgi:hypothetical protein